MITEMTIKKEYPDNKTSDQSKIERLEKQIKELKEEVYEQQRYICKLLTGQSDLSNLLKIQK